MRSVSITAPAIWQAATSAEPLRPLASLLAAQGASLLRPATDTGVDLIPLSVAGVPTLAPIQDARTYFDYHHSAADTIDRIRPDERWENVALGAVLTYALATVEGRLQGVPKSMPAWLKTETESRKWGAGMSPGRAETADHRADGERRASPIGRTAAR